MPKKQFPISSVQYQLVVYQLPVHRAYAKKAQVTIATLEEYEKRAAAASAIVPLPLPAVA